MLRVSVGIASLVAVPALTGSAGADDFDANPDVTAIAKRMRKNALKHDAGVTFHRRRVLFRRI